MDTTSPHPVEAAEVVLPCAELDETLVFFTERLGFRVDSIFPADAPSVVVVAGYGVRLRLERDGAGTSPDGAGVVRLLCRDPAAFADGATALTAPNGTRIELVAATTPVMMPPVEPSFVVRKMGTDAPWGVGRAGMHYRDLVPDRQGGAIIASHIRIPNAGPVPDYVHFHQVRFQMIYCYRGWVRLVYEDQGPPFVLAAGDCVLQPPEICHRVLEASAGLEVIEVGCPAEHLTCVDHALALPTTAVQPTRDFGGQRFVRHKAAAAAWRPWRLPGFAVRDTGIGAATDGLAGAVVARRSGAPEERVCSHDAELLFAFVLDGTVTLHSDGHGAHDLAAGDAFVVPAGLRHALTACADDLELLEVSLPATFATSMHPDAAL